MMEGLMRVQDKIRVQTIGVPKGLKDEAKDISLPIPNAAVV